MVIDLHCHAKLSKKAPFSINHFHKLQQAALRTGLQAIALTEHFNTRGFDQVYETLINLYPYRDDFFDVRGLKVFCGMEVDVREGGHILLIGKREEVLSLQKELSLFLDKGTFPPLDFLLQEAGRREMLKIGAHPFRNNHSLGRLNADLLKQLDCLELNGKDFKKEDAVIRMAVSLHLPVAAGSDAHHWLQVGCVRNQLDKDCTRVSQIRDCLKEGRSKTVIAAGIGLKLTGARVVKKILKRFSYA